MGMAVVSEELEPGDRVQLIGVPDVNEYGIKQTSKGTVCTVNTVYGIAQIQFDGEEGVRRFVALNMLRKIEQSETLREQLNTVKSTFPRHDAIFPHDALRIVQERFDSKLPEIEALHDDIWNHQVSSWFTLV